MSISKPIISNIISPILRSIVSTSGGFNPNSIAGLNQLLFVSEIALLSGYIADERTGLGDDRARRGGQVYLLDGVDDHVVLPSAIQSILSAVNDWAVMFRFKRAAAGAYHTLLGSGVSVSDGVGIGISAGNIIGATVEYASGVYASAGTASFTDTSDYHTLVINWDASGNTVSGYLDGVALGVSAGGFIQVGSNGAKIGIRNDAAAATQFSGNIASCKIYNSTLLDADAEALSLNETISTAPVAQYNCNEETGTISYDASGNDYHGTITNGTLSTFHASDATVENPADVVGYSSGYNQDDTLISQVSGSSSTLSFDINIDDSVLSTQIAFSDSSTSRYLLCWDEGSATTALSSGAGTPTYTIDGVLFSGTTRGDLYTALSGGVKSVVISNISFTAWISGLFFGGYPGIPVINVAISNVVLDGVAFNGDTIFPRNESTPTEDVLGSPLQYTGVAPNPGQAINSPCLTFDGTDDYVDLGAPLIPATDDFVLRFYYYHTTGDTNQYSLVSQYAAAQAGRFAIIANIGGVANVLGIALSGSNVATITNGVVVGEWHYITLTRSGGNLTLSSEVIGGATTSNSATDGAIYTGANTTIAALGTASNFSDGRFVDFEITSGGSTITRNPMSENAGATAYDVSGNGNHGTITNATTSPAGTGAWLNTQDFFHWSLAKGMSKPNTVQNGTFTTDTVWSKESGATIAGGVGVFSGGISERLRQDVLTIGETYRVSIEIVSYTSGTPSVQLGTTILPLPASTGVHTVSGVCAGAALFGVRGQSSICTVDNVFVTLVGLEVPALADGSADAQGNPITNPAGAKHNSGITDLTLNDGTWSFNDARTNPNFRRTLTSDGIAVAADRFASFDEALTGTDETNMDTYTETTEI